MGSEQIDLALKGGRLIPLSGQLVVGRLLPLGRQHVCTIDQRIHEILPVDGLEVSAI